MKRLDGKRKSLKPYEREPENQFRSSAMGRVWIKEQLRKGHKIEKMQRVAHRMEWVLSGADFLDR